MAPGLLSDSCSTTAACATKTQHVSQENSKYTSIADLNVQSYTQDEALVTDIVQSLRLSGGCIVRGMYSRKTLGAIEADIRPFIERTTKAHAGREDFVPSSTKMVTGLLSKSRTYALTVAGNKVWHQVCDDLLTSRLNNSWVGGIPSRKTVQNVH